ncbi:MAG: hypothetical protein CSYNP_04205 [Syntrophus sp. SKADARSKE-3]|nr:hypothetical protein [Syntrophus sp. SKADARSKE-3]
MEKQVKIADGSSVTTSIFSKSSALSNINRISSLDAVRGIMMILMALDHSRFFFSQSQVFLDPLSTTPALFFTRWVTNFCAPGFFLLAGCGAYLSVSRGKPLGQLSMTLATRGLWLIVLGFTVNKFFWSFTYDVSNFTAGIFWCLGCSMIFLSGMVFLPWSLILSVSLSMILLHNCFDTFSPDNSGTFSIIWSILHQKGPLLIDGFVPLYILYPLIPWIGVMTAGYCLGKAMLSEHKERRKKLFILGSILIIAFFLLRGFNLYGNPVDWMTQKNALLTFMNILECEKYPPSLSFLLITLGPILILIAALDRPSGQWMKPVIHFGEVPFFFYIIHIPLLNIISMIVSEIPSIRAYQLLAITSQPVSPADFQWDLPLTYGAWILAVMLLYPVCRRFARFKISRKDWWLSYL